MIKKTTQRRSITNHQSPITNPHSPITPEVVDDGSIAASLTAQYEAAQSSIKTSVQAVLKFGAMLIKAEQLVFAGQDGKKHRGTSESDYGLEAWLAEHCPTVNYKTAMRWKGIAANAVATLGCDTENAVKLLTGDTKGVSKELPVAEMKERIDELYEAKSIRQLSQMCFDFAAEDRDVGGRPKAEAKPLPKLKKSDEAKAIWNGVMQILSKSSVRDAIPLLGARESQICYDKLRDLADALKDHLGEF